MKLLHSNVKHIPGTVRTLHMAVKSNAVRFLDAKFKVAAQWVSTAFVVLASHEKDQISYMCRCNNPPGYTVWLSAYRLKLYSIPVLTAHPYIKKKKKKSSNGLYSAGEIAKNSPLKFDGTESNQVPKQSSLHREHSALLRFREREAGSVQKGFIDCT